MWFKNPFFKKSPFFKKRPFGKCCGKFGKFGKI